MMSLCAMTERHREHNRNLREMTNQINEEMHQVEVGGAKITGLASFTPTSSCFLPQTVVCTK